MSSDSSKSTESLVNGPINAVRLEGTIFGIKKILYVFMDFHIPVGLETQCNSFLSTDIATYIDENIRGSTRTIDLFVEIDDPELYKRNLSEYKSKYLEEMFKYFSSKWKIMDNKVQQPETNLRVHFADIRYGSMVKYINEQYYLGDILQKIIQSDYVIPTQVTHVIDIVDIVINLTNSVYKIFIGEKSDLKLEDISDNDAIIKYVNKIKTKYKHQELITKFAPLLASVEQSFRDLLENLTEIKHHLHKLVEKNNDPDKTLLVHTKKNINITFGQDVYANIDVISELRKLYQYYTELKFAPTVMLMDIFVLRRFLDKDYITDAISYTGAWHSCNYIYFLVKEFDFKVTHYSFARAKNVSEVNNKIRELNDYTEIPKLQYLFISDYRTQCSDMTNFPKHFQ